MFIAEIRIPVGAPSVRAKTAAQKRLDGLAKPMGALGQLEDLAAWLCAVQGVCPPRPIENVRAVVFAGDHGVTKAGVSAYPAEVTPAMVRAFLAGVAGVSVLARQHNVAVRVLDIAVDDDLDGVPEDVKRYKVRRSSGAIHVEDALSDADVQTSLEYGVRIAEEEIAAGADLLIGGDMGIGNTTPAACLIASSLGLSAPEVTGRGTGIDDAALTRKRQIIDQALTRVGDRADDPVVRLQALGSADMAVAVGFLIGAARAGVPVLLDGVISVAEAIIADSIAPGAAAWFAAGHRSPEPAQSLALDKFGLAPILDLGMRLGEGSGAVMAVPIVRSASHVLREMALLSDLVPTD